MSYERRHPLTIGDGFRIGFGIFLFQLVLIGLVVGVLTVFGIGLSALFGNA